MAADSPAPMFGPGRMSLPSASKGLSVVPGVVMNPFVNQTRDLTPLQKAKVLFMVCTFIPVVRAIFLLLLALLAVLIAKLGTCCHRFTDEHGHTVPLSRWRRGVLYPLRWVARATLFVMGVYWIHTKDEREPGKPKAPVIVANHVAIYDALYFASQDLPCSVAKAEIAKYPLIGTIFKATQPIMVYREAAAGRGAAMEAIQRRVGEFVENPSLFPQVLIFPEGTTTNTAVLTCFKKGAFVPGAAVQPVALQYPFKYFDPSWTPDVSLARVTLLALCQVYQSMHVRYLPLYCPSPEERQDPDLYARNVRLEIAKVMGVPVTEHSFDDVRLLHMIPRRYGLKHITPVSDVGQMRKLLQADQNTVTKVIQRFQAADKDKKGWLNAEEFAEALQMEPSDYSRRMFAMVDKNEDGRVDFAEVIAGLSWSSSYLSNEQVLKLMFSAFDRDGDGHISVADLTRMLGFVRSLSGAPAELTPEKVLETFDVNHNGTIEWEEFLQLAAAHEELVTLPLDVIRSRVGLPAHTRTPSAPVTSDMPSPGFPVPAGDEEAKTPGPADEETKLTGQEAVSVNMPLPELPAPDNPNMVAIVRQTSAEQDTGMAGATITVLPTVLDTPMP